MIKNKRSAFTLAEMMIVMLILTILLAAFAPLMTRKAKVDLSNPWRWAANNSDIYYGMGNNQTALIGQTSKAINDPNAKLLINSGSNPAIAFKYQLTESGVTTNPIRNLYIGNRNLSLGSSAQQIKGRHNTGFGDMVLNNMGGNESSYGSNNVAFGSQTLLNNHAGKENSAVGTMSLFGNTIGSQNSAFGSMSLYSNTKGDRNIAIGSYALHKNTEGNANIAIGYTSMYKNTTGYSNIALGGSAYSIYSNGTTGYTTSALQENTTGHDNIAIGSSSLSNNTTGYNNIAIGNLALVQNTSGSRNIGIGQGACQTVTTGQSKVCIGHMSGPNSSDGSTTDDNPEIYIGTPWDVVYIPGNVMIGGDLLVSRQSFLNYLYIDSGEGDGLGNGAFRIVESDGGDYIYGVTDKAATFYTAHKDVAATYGSIGGREGYSTSFWVKLGAALLLSDSRLKDIKGENTAGLEKIKQLKVYNYIYKKDKDKTPHVGVTAQELQKIFPDAIIKDKSGYLQVRIEDMFFAAINAIKELDKMLQDVIVQVQTLKTQVAEHDTEIKALQKENEELKAKVQDLEKQNKSFEARLKAIEKKL